MPFIVVAALYGIAPSRYLWAFPLAVGLQLILVTGVALFISSLNTILRDIQRGIGVILRMLFYLCPVLYPVTRITNVSLRHLYELNPLVGIFELYRAAWFPQYFADWRAVLAHLAIGLADLVAGRPLGNDDVGNLVVTCACGDRHAARDVGAGVRYELLCAVHDPVA